MLNISRSFLPLYISYSPSIWGEDMSNYPKNRFFVIHSVAIYFIFRWALQNLFCTIIARWPSEVMKWFRDRETGTNTERGEREKERIDLLVIALGIFLGITMTLWSGSFVPNASKSISVSREVGCSNSLDLFYLPRELRREWGQIIVEGESLP